MTTLKIENAQELIDYHKPDCPCCDGGMVTGRQLDADRWQWEPCEACGGGGTYAAFADRHDHDAAQMIAAVRRAW